MIGAPKAPAGGFSITSLPRTEAPATTTPESKPAEQTSGRDNNPVLRSLRTDEFEGHGARGRGLALGHKKRAARAEKAEEGKSQEALQKLIADLTKLVEQLIAQLQKPQPAPTTPGNTGIVPPPSVQVPPNGNTGIVPPGAVQGTSPAPTPAEI